MAIAPPDAVGVSARFKKSPVGVCFGGLLVILCKEEKLEKNS